MKMVNIILSCALFLPMVVIAQQTGSVPAPQVSPTPPAPPLLRRVPDMMEWVISYSREGQSTSQQSGKTAKEDEKKEELLERKTILKGAGFIFEATAITGAPAIQMWSLPEGLQLRSTDGKTWLVGAPSIAGFNTVDYSTQDFSGLGWIAEQNFKGEANYKGRKCFVFGDRVVTSETTEIEAVRSSMARSFNSLKTDDNGNVTVKEGDHPQFNIEDFKKEVFAYIDQETRLPIALLYKTPGGIVVRTYQYQKLQSMPTVPPEVKKALDAFKQREKSLSVPNAPI